MLVCNVRRGGEYTSPKNDIHLAWNSIGVCFIVGLMIWNTMTGFFTRFFFVFFFFFYYEDMIRSIWKVIQFFPVAGNIYDDIVIRGRLLCNSCGWRWNLLRIFDIETIDKSVWVKLVTRSNLIWIYKSEFRLTSDTSISEFNTKSFENLLLKSLLWYVFYESNLL